MSRSAVRVRSSALFLFFKPFDGGGQEVREGRGGSIYDLGPLGARLDLQKGFKIAFYALLLGLSQKPSSLLKKSLSDRRWSEMGLNTS
jgi:hypothetical protein